MSISNCINEKEGKCIPTDIGKCEACLSFELDYSKCSNYNEHICSLKHNKECPCKNYEPITD